MPKYNGNLYKIGMITKVKLFNGSINVLEYFNIQSNVYYKIRAFRRVKQPIDGRSHFIIYLEGICGQYISTGFAAEKFEAPIFDTPAARILYDA